MGLIVDPFPPMVARTRRRGNVLTRVFVGAFSFGVLLGAFAATSVWLMVR